MTALVAFSLSCFALASAVSVLDLGAPLRRSLSSWPALHGLVATPALTGCGAGLVLSMLGWGATGNPLIDALAGGGATRLLHLLVLRTWTARRREAP